MISIRPIVTGVVVCASVLFAGPLQGSAPMTDLRSGVECPSQYLYPAACCKTCRKGKACGDSCISRDKTCRKGPGCACNG